MLEHINEYNNTDMEETTEMFWWDILDNVFNNVKDSIRIGERLYRVDEMKLTYNYFASLTATQRECVLNPFSFENNTSYIIVFLPLTCNE